MTTFVIGQPVTTEVAVVTVDAGLKPGLHRFRLEVVDDAGLASRPAEAVVQVEQAATPIGIPQRPLRRTRQ